jgi:eukaryotic-like serine/threonine-protein kinase
VPRIFQRLPKVNSSFPDRPPPLAEFAQAVFRISDNREITGNGFDGIMPHTMALSPGSNLGPYEIQSSLGAGGMGEVYRARDTRLDRIVALKVLPVIFSKDPDRLHRFQDEARLLSTLDHPNVMAIFDVGEQDGIRYLVSEFLEGHTLREKLSAGPLSRWRTVEYALETARGLAAAHEKGIIHRDLKPDNIFITSDDRVKILDFGLAKQAPKQTDYATVTSPPTTPGTVLGTAGYMSPEQVRGQTIDHRSDIFSFGAVLYEMASGRRAFRGDSSVETMNAILKDEVPEISASGVQVSPGLERIIRRCLEKKPERRFQSASDLAFAVEALSGTSSSISQPAVAAPMPAGKRPLVLAAAGILALVLVGTLLWSYLRPRTEAPRFTQVTFRSAYIRAARFGGAGTVVYGATINGGPMEVFSTRTDTLEAAPMKLKADLLNISRGSEMALSVDRDFGVIWTPTGRLARAPLGGGATRELVDNVTDADWNSNGTELAVTRPMNGKFRLEYPLGKVLYETNGFVSEPRFSRSGDRIAFLDHPVFGDDRGVVSVVDLQGKRSVLSEEFTSEQGLAWSVSGNEIWFTASKSGEPSELRAVDLKGHSRVVNAGPSRLHLEDIASDGKVLLSSELLRWQTGIADTKTGRQTDLTAFQWPEVESISHDGSMILLNSFDIATDTNYRLYIQRTDGSSPVLIGEGAGTNISSDGRWAAAVDPTDERNASVIPTGVGETHKLRAAPDQQYVGLALFPDAKQLLISTVGSGSSPQTAVQEIESGAVHPVGTTGRYVESFAGMMSPGPSLDGRYCIQTDHDHRYWLQPLDGKAAREIRGVNSGERILQWHNDFNNVFVANLTGSDADIYTLNLTTGARKLWTHFSPAEKTALVGKSSVVITPDGTHYAYQVQRIYSTLFLADGLH